MIWLNSNQIDKLIESKANGSAIKEISLCWLNCQLKVQQCVLDEPPSMLVCSEAMVVQ
jgi:hypothetical protein